MAKNDKFGDEEEEYIDMELISSYSSPSKNKEFEFQNSLSSSNERETTTADELFYKGKLLPLHLLRTTTTTFDITKSPFQQYHNYYPMPFTAPSTNTANTPQDSSPSESCRASCELNPDDYFFEWSTELSSFINSNNNHPTKKPSKKLKLINKLKLLNKLKASRAYLKYLFTKSPCADESNDPKAVEQTSISNKYLSKKKQLGQIGRADYPTIASIIKNIDNEVIVSEDSSHNNNNVQRRSFSSAIKRHSPTTCLSSSSSNSSSSSSSFSANSNGFHEMQLIRRSSSATEIEGSIEAAIAHCKKSQQIFDSFSADEENSNRTGLS
ncbi:hypothetical protein BUALT_Bualt09G0067100 [Buddleja alternifolia]|uniref:Membrane-associated kinase regulator 4 n=1 Tax=Buddleja alternifolia TaxID=168488 RepID=A0AAV6X923_9LAMI|nr:hypothetical protein BUALT_Bualt09G0067100 [Buddleja alternifolia]